MWLDQGSGSCVLNIPQCRTIVKDALHYFDNTRYALGKFVVAPNHVHVIVAPKPDYKLSSILHSWKSFTAKEILKIDAIKQSTRGKATLPHRRVWQKESFDHIIRSSSSLERIEKYIQDHYPT